MKRISIAVVLVLTLFSCTKVLDKKPFDAITPQDAFNNEQGLQLYTNSFYNMLPSARDIFSADQLSDYAAINSFPVYLTNSFNAQQASGWDWGDLRNINYFLENYNNPAIPAFARNHYAGIAHFFRALFYYNMVKKFGNVPWYNKTLDVNDPDLYKARDPRTMVMDSVLADLDFAIENIDDTKDGSATHITSWVALAFKSRVCLFEGSIRKYHTEFDLQASAHKWFEEAADAAGKLMASDKYKLHLAGGPGASYRALFTSEKPVEDEVILAIAYNNELRKFHDANWWFTSATYGPRLSLNRSFIHTYLKADGTPFTDSPMYDTTRFQLETIGRDARLGQTIRTPGYKRSDGTPAPPDFSYSYTGYQVKKFTTDDRNLDSKAENFNSIPFIRYAEVLLNYAEAKAELGSFNVADWDATIKLLRNRAGITNTPYPTVADSYLQTEFFPGISDPVLLEIRRERGVELAVEGLRFDDLVRWKAGDLLVKTYNGIYVPAKNVLYDMDGNGDPDVSFVDVIPATKVPGVIYYVINGTTTKLSEGDHGNLLWLDNMNKLFDQKRYLYPIPADQVVLNPKLEQNDGWE